MKGIYKNQILEIFSNSNPEQKSRWHSWHWNFPKNQLHHPSSLSTRYSSHPSSILLPRETTERENQPLPLCCRQRAATCGLRRRQHGHFSHREILRVLAQWARSMDSIRNLEVKTDVSRHILISRFTAKTGLAMQLCCCQMTRSSSLVDWKANTPVKLWKVREGVHPKN